MQQNCGGKAGYNTGSHGIVHIENRATTRVLAARCVLLRYDAIESTKDQPDHFQEAVVLELTVPQANPLGKLGTNRQVESHRVLRGKVARLPYCRTPVSRLPLTPRPVGVSAGCSDQPIRPGVLLPTLLMLVLSQTGQPDLTLHMWMHTATSKITLRCALTP